MFAHAFGQRYELPIPLALFVFGGAAVVLLSFFLVLRSEVTTGAAIPVKDRAYVTPFNLITALVSFALLGALITAGIIGSQTVAENILPTLFWLGAWVAIPLSCGLLGDWTQPLNPFANVAKLADRPVLRRFLLRQEVPFAWPAWLGWWPAVVLFFTIASGELIYNQLATLPAVTAMALLVYFIFSGLMGLLFGKAWCERGEVWSVLYATWGRLGYFRFGAPGAQRFVGGLQAGFEASPSRIAFVLLLLVSVSFDGLLATPAWAQMQQQLPHAIAQGTLALKLLTTLAFIALAAVIWLVFTGFSLAAAKAGGYRRSAQIVLAGLLPSLLPISFGYLLAHNFEYLIVNGQLLFPLIGNPVGGAGWPFHLPYPFNDSYEIQAHLLPNAAYWYVAVVVIVTVHIIAVVVAHRHFGTGKSARRAEYPWVLAMVAYTMLSLWLLAQPLVKEKTAILPTYHALAIRSGVVSTR